MEAEEERREANWPNLVGYESTPDYDGPVSGQEETQQQEPTTSTTSSGEDLTTAPTTADTTTQQTCTATPLEQGGSYALEANAVTLALETSTTASATAHRLVHRIPDATTIEQDERSRLECPPKQIQLFIKHLCPPRLRKGGNNELEVNVVESANEHLTTAPSRAHPAGYKRDLGIVFEQEEYRGEVEVNAALPTAGQGGTGDKQAEAAEDDVEEEEEDDIADDEDDGSGEYIETPDDQAADGDNEHGTDVGGPEVVVVERQRKRVLRSHHDALHTASAELPVVGADGHEQDKLDSTFDESMLGVKTIRGAIHSKRSRRIRTARSGLGEVDAEDDGFGKCPNTENDQAGASKPEEDEEEEDEELVNKMRKASQPRHGTRLPGPVGRAVPVFHQRDEEEEQKKKSQVRSTWLETFKEPGGPIDAKAKTRSQQAAIKQESARKETKTTPQNRDGTRQGQPESPSSTPTDRHNRKRQKAPNSSNVTQRSSPEVEDARSRKVTARARARAYHILDKNKSSASASQKNNDTLEYLPYNPDSPSPYSSAMPPALAPSPPKLRRGEPPRPMDSSCQTGVEFPPEETDPDNEGDNEGDNEDDNDNDARSTASIPFERPTTSDTEQRSAARRRLPAVAPGNTTTTPQPLTIAEQDAADHEVINAAMAVIDATNRRRAMQGLPLVLVRTEEANANGEAAGKEWAGKGRAE